MAVPEKEEKPREDERSTVMVPDSKSALIAETRIKTDVSRKSANVSPVHTPTVQKVPILIEKQEPQSTNVQRLRSETNASPVPVIAATKDARDPFIIAKLHNRDHSPLYRIPEELVLCIVECFDPTVSADLAALFCMARVSNLLRRCVQGSQAQPGPDKCFLQEALESMVGAKNMVKYFLRQDLLCARCLTRSDLRMTRAGEIVPRHRHGQPIWSGCKFEGHRVKGIGPLYCSGCDAIHHYRLFSATERQKKGSKRICIGREGKLRLCGHQAVKWIDIEQYLVDILTKESSRADGRRGVLPIITCDDPQHRTCLSGSQKPPTMSLTWYDTAPNRRWVFLQMDWDAHAAITLNSKGRLDSRDARAMFQTHIQTGPYCLQLRPSSKLPQYGQAPAMGCFSRECTCLTWDYGDTSNKENGTDLASNHHRQSATRGEEADGYDTCPLFGSTKLNSEGDIKRHSEPVSYYHVLELNKCGPCAVTDSNQRCLATEYFQITTVGYIGKNGLRVGNDGKARIKPTHEWLHALDPDSYQVDDDTRKFGNIWPNCKDASCWKHYRTYQADGHVDLERSRTFDERKE